jgi:alginate O-acetyltransferase complex protein AlgI
MLFNSPAFILVFLPIVITGFFVTARLGGPRAAMLWLVVASFVFYGYFKFRYVFLLAGLIVANFYFGRTLLKRSQSGDRRPWLLALFIAVNLGLLCFFKYTNFLIGTANGVFGKNIPLAQIVLPLGISFFTFQKIAYLVDCYRGEVDRHDFLDFSLFVSFFPQLIAGPIVHHREMMPQFRNPEVFKFSARQLALGLILFAIGLAKKSLLADPLSQWSDTGFAVAHPGLIQAWDSALAFTFQIYFDFSGYTDMALGLALMIGIRLPSNFASPYAATSIIDFWRRWHMTLSRFLRDYVYFPLGGNRRGCFRRYANLLVTMLIGGLWHGAAWTFVFWGALHGFYLVVNHAWRFLAHVLGIELRDREWYRWICRVITFLSVVVAWVFFRAPNFRSAFDIVAGMAGAHGFQAAEGFGELAFLTILLVFVWLLPNSQQLLGRLRPVLQPPDVARLWTPLRGLARAIGLVESDGTIALSATTGALVGLLIFGILLFHAIQAVKSQTFIYFQF